MAPWRLPGYLGALGALAYGAMHDSRASVIGARGGNLG
jgi:hypothetical protein